MKRLAFKSPFQRSQAVVSGDSAPVRSSLFDHLSVGNVCLFLAVTASVVGLTAGLTHSRHADAVTHQSSDDSSQVNASASSNDQGNTQASSSTSGAQQTTSSSSSVHSTVSSGSGQTSTTVTVNGQPIAVPQNGTNQQTITNPDGTTSVTVSNSQNSDGSSYNTSVTTTTNNSVQSSSSSNKVVNFESHTGGGSTPP